MSFGFEAASVLKADTISYAPKAKDYLKYFRWGPGLTKLAAAGARQPQAPSHSPRGAFRLHHPLK